VPYVLITTREHAYEPEVRALATEREVREAVRLALTHVPRGTDLDAISDGFCPRVGSFGPQGCTIGPLPDGSRIAVDRRTWSELATTSGIELRWDPPVADGDYLHERQRAELMGVLEAYPEAVLAQ
jgi:hypothetical protein